jgi:membrane protease YdiL (CAAX protease family)
MILGKDSAADYTLLALLILYPLVEWRWYWPRVSRAIRAGIPGARTRLYRDTIAVEWLGTLYVFALWIVWRRPWSTLWLDGIRPLRFFLGCLLAVGVIIFFGLQTRKVQKALAQPKVAASLREKFAFAYALVPGTAGERRTFWLLSITAGVCEEIIYRGFLIWLVATWTGLIAAVVISSIVFGLAHIYLGVAQVPRTAIIGFLLAIVVVASGSILPAIVIHAAMDLNSGEIGFRVAQAPLANGAAPAPLTS